MTDIVIVEGARTAHGAMLGSLSEVRAPDPGAAAVEELVDRAGVAGADVDWVGREQVVIRENSGVHVFGAEETSLAAPGDGPLPQPTKLAATALYLGERMFRRNCLRQFSQTKQFITYHLRGGYAQNCGPANGAGNHGGGDGQFGLSRLGR